MVFLDCFGGIWLPVILVVYLYIPFFWVLYLSCFFPSQRIENLCWISFISNFSAYQVKKKNIAGNISKKKSTFQKKKVPEISEVASNLLSKTIPEQQQQQQKNKKKLEQPLPDSQLTFCWIFSTKSLDGIYLFQTCFGMFQAPPPLTGWAQDLGFPKVMGPSVWLDPMIFPDSKWGWSGDLSGMPIFLKLPNTKKNTATKSRRYFSYKVKSHRGV